jgi:sugar/nucleoside kinase (ribokinase family)
LPGASWLDSMTLVDDLTSERLTAATGSISGVSGGSAANTIVGVASFGGHAGYIGHVANDPVGGFFIEDLREAGVEFDRPARATDIAGTGRCLALVTPDGERTMATYLGASLLIPPDDLDVEMLRCTKVVYLEGYLSNAPRGPDVLRDAAQRARLAGADVAIRLSDSYCVERHYELLTELVETGRHRLCQRDRSPAPERQEGPRGGSGILQRSWQDCRDYSRSSGLHRPVPTAAPRDRGAPDRPARDRTGAGDLYAAGFLFGWTHGGDPETCGMLGSLAASEIVSHIGARPERSLRELATEFGLHQGFDEFPTGDAL